jgi:hypothetical protein
MQRDKNKLINCNQSGTIVAQIETPTANVIHENPRFHENDRNNIGGVDCVMVEADIDYYSDPAAHIIAEVLPHGLTHSLTGPTRVHVLRWMAGRTAGVPEFASLYTIV